MRTTDPNLALVVAPTHALEFAAQPANIDTVVDGRILLRGGQFTALDGEPVMREAAEAVQAVYARAGWP